MLQIRNIRKEYRTGDLLQKALDDVSLNLRDNEFVAILGPSGSGKTTLLNILGGLDRYDEGDLIINGISTKEYKDRNWDTYRNHSVGFVFQSYNLIPHQNILSNVELALTIGGISPKERKERAIKALEDVGLADQIHKKPNQLSGGQMQRVALARALVNDPDILLADEPTGALDTETSLQVMDLLKKVADDRLVVMVTHNPDLADEYASRIVKLKDGKITDDSMPYTDEQVRSDLDAKTQEDTETGKKRKRLSGMSFLTSLVLSFHNLRTKKGRTILTAFAGAIGIIGIALILSLSTGVNNYIDQIQKDTLTSYPISITATSFDMSALMGPNPQAIPENASAEKPAREKDMVYANYQDLELNTSVNSSIKENNLTDFKKYLDDPESEIHQYIGEHGVVYSYNVDFKVYTYDQTGKLVDTDADTRSEFSSENSIFGNLEEVRSLMISNMSTLTGGSGTNHAENFAEMPAGTNQDVVSPMIKDNYDVVYGSWPDAYDEVVLVLSRSNTLFSGTLYQLGYLTERQYKNAIDKVKNQEEAQEARFSYEQLMDHTFYLLTASDNYEKRENGTFSYIGDDKTKLKTAAENGVHLKIVGLVKRKEGSDIQGINATIGYTTLLTDYLINRGSESDVIKAQEETPDVNVLTGQKFEESDLKDSEKAKKARQYVNDLGMTDKASFFSLVMMLDYEGGMEALMTTQMGEIGAVLGPNLEYAIRQAMNQAVYSAIDSARNAFTDVIEEVTGEGIVPIEIPTLPPDETTKEPTSEEPTSEEPTSEEATSEEPTSEEPTSEEPTSEEPTSEEPTSEEPTSEEPTSEEPTEETSTLPRIDWEKLREELEKLPLDRIPYSFNFGDNLNINLDLGSLASGLDFSMGEEDMADIVQYWLDNFAKEEALVRIYEDYMGRSSYDDNMKQFGLVSYDAPSSISIYADSFEAKDGIAASIERYNDGKAEEDKIVYTDYVALLTSSITTIINAISYVLIGFVAVSLFVSCIMIGVITNISVLERTKEIGVLRALGASKANISQVFNAETFIIGCLSGIIGVGVSLLLILPINSIIHALTDNLSLNAKLPLGSALILIVISIVITIIGGLIPSRKAAKKDPVIALRTE